MNFPQATAADSSEPSLPYLQHATLAVQTALAMIRKESAQQTILILKVQKPL
jgi:hypothetical protein